MQFSPHGSLRVAEPGETVKIKRLIEIAFIVVASSVILAQAARIVLIWREGRLIQNEIRKGARVAVLKINPRFPPGLLLEYENSSRHGVRKISFWIVFESNGLEEARADRDLGNIQPGEKKIILLESLSVLTSGSTPSPKSLVKYRLFVSVNSKKPLPEITGEFEIQ
jgi:hypothetical protein